MASESSRSSHSKKRHKSSKRKIEETVRVLKHVDTFYEHAPPGLVRHEEERPEDCIPDEPENKEAREFLAKAPTKGLWMPLGKEVKVMKCWRCKTYGHRTGDRECPLFVAGNAAIEKFRFIHEDPMHNFIIENKKREKLERVQQLKALLESCDSDSESSSTSTSASSSSSSTSEKHRKRKKKRKQHSKSKKVKRKKRKS